MANEYEQIVEREIVTTRVIDADREAVFQAWMQADRLKHWWGPRGFTNTFDVFDMKPKGSWRYTMHAPNGANYQNEAEVIEIVSSERIVLDHVSAPRFRLTVLFDELGERSKITFRQLFETPAVCNQVKQLATQGNEDNLERLADFVRRVREHNV